MTFEVLLGMILGSVVGTLLGWLIFYFLILPFLEKRRNSEVIEMIDWEKWLHRIAGAYLVIDCIGSMLFFYYQPSVYHIPRFLRGVVGAWLLAKGS
jgi:hypothetical protein